MRLLPLPLIVLTVGVAAAQAPTPTEVPSEPPAADASNGEESPAVPSSAPPIQMSSAPSATPEQTARPARLPYQEGVVPPEGYRIDEHMRKGLVLGGGVVFGAAYVLGIGLAVTSDWGNHGDLLVLPVLGPVLTLATRSKRDGDGAVVAGLCLDQIVQLAGATMMIVGITSTKKEFVRDDVARVSVGPARVGATGYGAQLFGSF